MISTESLAPLLCVSCAVWWVPHWKQTSEVMRPEPLVVALRLCSQVLLCLKGGALHSDCCLLHIYCGHLWLPRFRHRNQMFASFPNLLMRPLHWRAMLCLRFPFDAADKSLPTEACWPLATPQSSATAGLKGGAGGLVGLGTSLRFQGLA